MMRGNCSALKRNTRESLKFATMSFWCWLSFTTQMSELRVMPWWLHKYSLRDAASQITGSFGQQFKLFWVCYSLSASFHETKWPKLKEMITKIPHSSYAKKFYKRTQMHVLSSIEWKLYFPTGEIQFTIFSEYSTDWITYYWILTLFCAANLFQPSISLILSSYLCIYKSISMLFWIRTPLVLLYALLTRRSTCVFIHHTALL